MNRKDRNAEIYKTLAMLWLLVSAGAVAVIAESWPSSGEPLPLEAYVGWLLILLQFFFWHQQRKWSRPDME